MRIGRILCAMALTIPTPAISQASANLSIRVDSGSRVRITAPVFGRRKQITTVVSVSRDTLVLQHSPKASYLAVPVSEISAFEVSKGTYTRKSQGAALGWLIGAGIGAALGYFTFTDPDCGEFGCGLNYGPESRGASVAVGGFLLGIVGAMAGAFVGSQPTDVWERVAIPAP